MQQDPVEDPNKQRSAYRDSSVAVRSLGVELTLSNKALRAELVDISIGGVGLKVPAAKDPNLPEGAVVELRITGSLRSEIVTPGKMVRSAADKEGFLHYAFQFLDIGNLQEQLDPFYQQYFNRRADERVRPRFDHRVLVDAFTEDGQEVSGALYDISKKGLGIATKGDLEGGIKVGSKLTVKFDLPLAPATLVGTSTVRNVLVKETYTLIGVEFLDLGQDTEVFEREVKAYILDREAELTRWTRSLV